ncbi:hypothetical protein PIROE2DRAFT_11580 [Piromyces sp. E2]|nr:hypothetical protein PIROE2DRAFT_11580 [Piromyces sp. E2]|eukprot:OUM62213.1 hypothetical protein PIROE2DRAFT_11580 [Piromyces sp. E2]
MESENTSQKKKTESSGGKWVIKINSWIQSQEDKISNYILKAIRKHKEKINNVEQEESLEIKIQDQISNQSGTHSNVTVKSCNYSQDQNNYVTGIDTEQKASNNNTTTKNTDSKKETNSNNQSNNDKDKRNTKFYSITNSPSSNIPNQNFNNTISTNSSTLNALPNFNNTLSTNSSTLNAQVNLSQINNNCSSDISTENEQFINDLFQKEHESVPAYSSTLSFSVKSEIPPSSSSIQPLTNTSQATPNQAPSVPSSSIQTPSLNSNTMYRGIINFSDYELLHKKIPGQITSINNNNNNNNNNNKYSLHIQCSGQGPVTVLFESGLFISSYLLWHETYQRTSNFTKTCIYDRAGYGWSDMGTLPRTQEQEIQELTELLNQSNLDGPFLLVSHSYGNVLSTTFAIQNKNKIKGMILVEPFFVTSEFTDSNYLLYNLNNLKSTFYWGGLNSAINKDITSISSIEYGLGLPMDILSRSKEMKLIRNIKLFKTVYSELNSYNSDLNQSKETIETLKELMKDIPTKIIIGDQTVSHNHCKNDDTECIIKDSHNNNYLSLIKKYCDWDKCELKIAENSGYYVPLERLDIVINMIYNFI